MRKRDDQVASGVWVRLAAIGALALAAVAVGILLLSGGDEYRVRAHFSTASQLVNGNVVKYGGRQVGVVEQIELTDDGRAEIEMRIDDEKLKPLRQGTRAHLRLQSLSGLANRYVDLELPSGKPDAIPDGGLIEETNTTTQVNIDQFFNLFDRRTRAGLRGFIRGSATAYGARGVEANAGYRFLNPSLVGADRLFREINYDTPMLERFLIETSRLTGDIAERRDDLAKLIDRLATTFGAIAREDESLASAIGQLPPFMRQANTTFVNLRSTLDDLAPLVEESKPVAPKLRRVLPQLRAFAEGARPTVRDLSAIVRQPGKDNDLLELSRAIPPFRDVVIGPVRANGQLRPGAFETSARSLRGQTPIFAFQRPYSVDLTGWFDDFSHSGLYDANGNASRIATGVNAFVTVGGTLQPVPPALREAALQSVLVRGQNNRCPGSVERPAEDGNNPFRPSADYNCDPSQIVPGE